MVATLLGVDEFAFEEDTGAAACHIASSNSRKPNARVRASAAL